MQIYNENQIIHYPSLRTMLMVEKVLKEADTIIEREELKRRLPSKTMHQTLNLILKYLEEKGMIIDGHNFEEINDAVGQAKAVFGKPTVIIANTISGKGGWHV